MLKDVPTPAAVLGFLGVVPFIVCAVLVWRLSEVAWVGVAVSVQNAYGAVVLSYLGGVRWGLAIGGYGALNEASGASWGRLGWTVVPVFLAWLSVLVPPPASLLVLMVSYALAYFSDVWASRGGTAPAWYASLRATLSFAVILSLAITLFRFPQAEAASLLDALPK